MFVGGASYEATFEEDDIDPGDTLGLAIGTFLAASPNTSVASLPGAVTISTTTGRPMVRVPVLSITRVVA